MNPLRDLAVFISYRRADGTELALWLKQALHGRTVWLPRGSILVPAVMSVYLDQAAPAVSDWRPAHQGHLEKARFLLVVCTPEGLKEATVGLDHFYRELRWWLDHRRDWPPIFITSPRYGHRTVPGLLRDKWPHPQVVKVDPSDGRLEDVALTSIVGGIVDAFKVVDQHNSARFLDPIGIAEINQPNLYTWAKDRHGVYIGANDNYAAAAGFDSPTAMLGKTDFVMPWRTLAEQFLLGDRRIISGAGPSRINVQEKEIMVDKVADILVTEAPLLDSRGEIIGVVGHFSDITGLTLVDAPIPVDVSRGLSLGEQFGKEHITRSEAEVLKGLVRRQPRAQIARKLGITNDTLSECIVALQRKLQCTTEGELIVTAINAGLAVTLFGWGLIDGD